MSTYLPSQLPINTLHSGSLTRPQLPSTFREAVARINQEARVSFPLPFHFALLRDDVALSHSFGRLAHVFNSEHYPISALVFWPPRILSNLGEYIPYFSLDSLIKALDP